MDQAPAFIVKQNLFRSRVDVRQLGAKVYATIRSRAIVVDSDVVLRNAFDGSRMPL